MWIGINVYLVVYVGYGWFIWVRVLVCWFCSLVELIIIGYVWVEIVLLEW